MVKTYQMRYHGTELTAHCGGPSGPTGNVPVFLDDAMLPPALPLELTEVSHRLGGTDLRREGVRVRGGGEGSDLSEHSGQSGKCVC